MKRITVIMAGGGGTRFWPLSRQAKPKQLISLTSDKVMINQTIDHFHSVVERKDTFIVTNQKQENLMKTHVYPEVPRDQILIEPVGRNTAPCILYAALAIEHAYKEDVVMAVLPADHHISDLKEYNRILDLAYKTAETEEKIITIGLWPTYPATGYGYIRFGEHPIQEGSEVYPLQRFVEKPDGIRATEYLKSGHYLWNSGMFIWKASVIIKAFQEYLPDLYDAMIQIKPYLGTSEQQTQINKIYGDLPSVSIDYGIMEKTTAVQVIPAEFGWNDVGSWDALASVFPLDNKGNVVKSKYLGIDTHDCIIKSTHKDKIVATLGVKDLIIVDTEDALLICHKDQAQEVKQLVDELKAAGEDQLI